VSDAYLVVGVGQDAATLLGYRLEHLDGPDLTRAAELERTYAGLDLGPVDASVIALCERLGEPKVATLDRRDFAVVRPAHVETLQLLPE
jgi:predicted nucleic acid-binding protein